MNERLTDASKAVKDGVSRERASVMNMRGRFVLLEALERGDRDGVKKSIEILRRAKDESERTGDGSDGFRPRVLFNLAMAQAAAGEDVESQRSFGDALRINSSLNKRLVPRAITDLQLVRSYCARVRSISDCDALSARIDRMKEAAVAATWYQPASLALQATLATRKPSVEDLEIAVTPYEMQWRALNSLAEQDQLAILWFEFDADWGIWRVLPDVSGIVERNGGVLTPGAWISTPVLTRTRFERCMGSVPYSRYRAELFVNGRFVGTSREATMISGAFKVVRLDDLNIALCSPSDWKVASLARHPRSDDFLATTLQTPEGRPAAFVFTFHGVTGGDAPGAHLLKNVQAVLAMEKQPNGAERPFALIDRGGLDACSQTLTSAFDKGQPAYMTWTTAELVRHAAIVLPAARTAHACVLLRSMANRHGPAEPSRRADKANPGGTSAQQGETSVVATRGRG